MARPHPLLYELAAGRLSAGTCMDTAAFDSAVEHRMAGLTLTALQNGTLQAPADVWRGAAMVDLGQRVQHDRLWAADTELGAALGGIGAEVTIVKGIATVQRWYDRPGERLCRDLDLWVDPGDLSRIVDIVGVIDGDYPYLDQVRTAVQHGWLQNIDLVWGDVAVDLHFDPLKMGVPTLAAQQVWDTCERVDAPTGGTARVLSREMELVLFVLHLNKDRFAYLGPFVDVARILDGPELDWDSIAAFVEREGFAVPFWKSFQAVADTLLVEVEPISSAGRRGQVWDRLWGPERRLLGNGTRQQATTVQRALTLLARGRGADARHEIRRQLMPPGALLDIAGVAPGNYLKRITTDRVARTRGRRPGSAGAAHAR